MKVHEEEKIYKLLSVLDFTEEQAEKIISVITDSKANYEDIDNIVLNIKNLED